jgi:hypothetical protein
MIKQGHFQYRKATIPANGEESFIVPDSNFIKCTNSEGANFKALCDEVEMVLFGGFDYTFPDGDAFSRVRLINPNPQPITVDLYFGKGSIRDNNLSISQNHFYPQISQGGSECETLANVALSGAAAKLFDANARTVAIAVSATGGDAFVGGPEVAAGKGILIPAGTSKLIRTSAEVWAFAASATVTRTRFFF